jgi:hypothetical protein
VGGICFNVQFPKTRAVVTFKVTALCKQHISQLLMMSVFLVLYILSFLTSEC